MLLAIDIGNSQTSYGVFEGSNLLHHWRAETKVSRTEDEYASLLFPLLDYAGLKSAEWEAIIICSVVPPVERTLEAFCRLYLSHSPFKIHSGLKIGFSFDVEVPSEVGADRLANGAYAVKYLKLPAVVVDLGTATTFDVVTQDRVYRGGLILPGVRMGVEALGSKTSKLPMVDLEYPPSVIGRNTVDCIRSGILFGYLEAMNGLLDRLEVELRGLGDIALTGGLSPLFRSRMRREVKWLPNLTLEGAEIIYRQSQTPTKTC